MRSRRPGLADGLCLSGGALLLYAVEGWFGPLALAASGGLILVGLALMVARRESRA